MKFSKAVKHDGLYAGTGGGMTDPLPCIACGKPLHQCKGHKAKELFGLTDQEDQGPEAPADRAILPNGTSQICSHSWDNQKGQPND